MKKIDWEVAGPKPKVPFYEKVKWYEVGGMLSLLVLMYSAYLFLYQDLTVKAILVFNLFALLIHQFEKYGFPGWYPGMLNRWVFDSKYPLHYPLNRRSAWVVNVIYAWGLYVAGIGLENDIPSLGMVCILLSMGSVLGHIGFSIKARKVYNPGLISAIVLFIPTILFYFIFADPAYFYGERTFWNGILLGVIANAMAPLLVLIFADEKSKFDFGARHEVPQFRKFKNYMGDE